MLKCFSLPVVFLLVLGSSALAEIVNPVSANGPPRALAVDNDDVIDSVFAARNSYCCSVYPEGSTTNVGLSTSVVDPDLSNVVGFVRGDVAPAIAVTGGSDTIGNSDNRICLFTEKTGNYSFSFISLSSPQVVLAQCGKTSISGGFNTNGTPINFLECTNNSESQRSIRVYAVDSSGTTLLDGGTASGQFTIDAGLRRDIDVHSAVGSQSFGEIRVAHDGPKGSVVCSTSRYSSDLTLLGNAPLK